MRDEINLFVKTSLVCQQDKPKRRPSSGLLKPLSIPSYSWESVSMCFITKLPKLDGYGSILVEGISSQSMQLSRQSL